ncbi:MAG: GIY-YIG nuclease family protein [Cyanobacteria bacterium P01_A01_bin.123]
MTLDPSKINPSTLPSVALKDRQDLPEEPCIYFAIDSQGTVQYIGQSVNPKRRWNREYHHRYEQLSGLGSCRIAYLNCPSHCYLQLLKLPDLIRGLTQFHWWPSVSTSDDR